MSDNDDAATGGADTPSRTQLAAVYLESLAACMDPGEFQALAGALNNLQDVLQGHRGASFTMDDKTFTEGVHKELLMLLTIVATGRMDHQVVEVPGPDGGRVWTAVNSEVAEDPVRLEEVRARMRAWQDRQGGEDGSGEASGGGS